MIRSSSRFTALALTAAAFAALGASPLAAQGSISSLGFGYPVSSGSTRSNGAAGAFNEFDALTPVNPAALGGVRRTVVSAQAESELRTLRFGTASEKSTIARVPLLMLVFPAGRGFAVGLSGTSFLDRSYRTTSSSTVIIDGTPVNTNDISDVRGSIGDLRAAVGWQMNSRVRVGVGGHVFTGETVVSRERTFADSLFFGGILDSSRVTFFGTALSLGSEITVGKGVAVMASFRSGNTLDSRVRDTVRTSGNVPNRIGLGLRYSGIAGSLFAVNVEQVEWSKIAPLGSSSFSLRDAMNWNAGAEVAGPRFRGLPMLVRAGYAKNELPFSTLNTRANESRLSAGLGVPIAREAASIDLSVQRVNRSLSGSGAKESAWMFGIGIQVRP